MWIMGHYKESKSCIIGVPEREVREKAVESQFKEIMTANFPNLGRNLEIQVHKALKLHKGFNPNCFFPIYILIQLFKLKAQRES